MKKYPDLTLFTLKAYYETDPEVFSDIQKIIGRVASFEVNAKFLKISPEKFVEGIDLQMMYMDMYLASEGYLWEKSHQGRLIALDSVENLSKTSAKRVTLHGVTSVPESLSAKSVVKGELLPFTFLTDYAIIDSSLGN